jgi:hypothetical protein
MPRNYTYDKVREIVESLKEHDEESVRDAVSALSHLKIAGPLQSVIFIKHHLDGDHETTVDRIISDEESGEQFAVLSYPEGELPVKLDKLPGGPQVSKRLRYNAAKRKYELIGNRSRKGHKKPLIRQNDF